MKTTLGGDRLGSGNKQEISLRNYERSTHDLGYIWRSSMASGTLVPFMTEVGLPGDSFDIDLETEVLTLPTLGPLFGSYKVQLDVFQIPMRLYNAKLHMNALGIGMDMSQIKLPQIQLEANSDQGYEDNAQINPSCIFSYLGVRGLGRRTSGYEDEWMYRDVNAIPYLAYWDIYKNYYANKQEERGFVIHNDTIQDGTIPVIEGKLYNEAGTLVYDDLVGTMNSINWALYTEVGEIHITIDKVESDDTVVDVDNLTLRFLNHFTGEYEYVLLSSAFDSAYVSNQPTTTTYGTAVYSSYNGALTRFGLEDDFDIYPAFVTDGTEDDAPKLEEFQLSDIDDMRELILGTINSQLTIREYSDEVPRLYKLPINKNDVKNTTSLTKAQEGLGVKTYQSDLFNNWISTEWIDGDNGINAITSVDTSEGNFTIDALNLSKKVYDMLNRIAVSGGTYDDWLNAVYTHDRVKSVESPIYHGSLIKELAFQEVVSNSDTDVNGEQQPLGTLAGRGVLTKKNKGGKMKIKVDEPSYIMGIVSITPRIDYSQGNKWDANLKTMDDLHKPALDGIGFQDLITDQMAWQDTIIDSYEPEYKSAGKQPAWINYMTNVNQVRGTFAEKNSQMFMTLNRRYEIGKDGIEDLTTYVDPTKFNHIFADTRLDAQNFWTQIKINNIARRKMSAKIIPNL